MSMHSNIVGIVISYQPDLEMLGRLLSTLLPQVQAVVVVDNGSLVDIKAWCVNMFDDKICVISLGENHGIAAAQNAGINWSRTHGAHYVVLFDQDSEPAADMVSKLRSVAEAKATEGHAVAAVGPRYIDERQDNPPPFIQVRNLRLKRHPCVNPEAVVEVDYLIASGCLIPISTLDVVGDLQEGLFIDYVDIEWGLRAKSRGFQSFGVCAAFMHHSLGDTPITWLGVSFPSRSPLRHYYLFRNAVWLYRQRFSPFDWKLVDGWRLFLKYIFYSLFAKPRFVHWRMMTLGMWHGLVGKIGKFEGSAS